LQHGTLCHKESENIVAENKNPPGTLDRDDNPGEYVLKTVRSSVVVATFITLWLAGVNRYEMILPLLTGTALGCSLIWSWERMAVAFFTPERARKKKTGGKWIIILFALVKYPMVAYLIYWATRHWNQTQLLWFVGGFILVQAVIVLRALGRSLMENSK
jgi:hypothetical protein